MCKVSIGKINSYLHVHLFDIYVLYQVHVKENVSVNRNLYILNMHTYIGSFYLLYSFDARQLLTGSVRYHSRQPYAHPSIVVY